MLLSSNKEDDDDDQTDDESQADDDGSSEDEKTLVDDEHNLTLLTRSMSMACGGDGVRGNKERRDIMRANEDDSNEMQRSYRSGIARTQANENDRGDANRTQNSAMPMRQNNETYYDVPRFTMNFRDIEDTIRTFDGSGELSVGAWIEEFEENATIMHWDEFQMFIFAKRSLRGLAKLLISSERGVTSWRMLKKTLLDEFGTTVNSAQIHKMLTGRKILKDENIQEYFLRMKEIASQGNVEDSALMQYVINGITDSVTNKAVLYGAEDLSEFKKKLRIYEQMQNDFKQKDSVKVTQSVNTKNNRKSEKSDTLCFNCGGKGHLSKDCKNASKGTKCFSCNKYGHISKDCPSKQDSAVRRIVSDNDMNINVEISGREFKALFDTGSKFNIMSKDIYNSLNKPKLSKSNFHLVGFGNGSGNRVKPIGNSKFYVGIDGEKYELVFHVVEHTCINTEIIIGADLSYFAEIVITPNGIKINKLANEECDETFNIMAIDAIENSADIDVDD
ncbi:uncharacterized protein LOC142237219 [Haematobia irritans]|uniref:uncharacterized protein LOC142237219 n=1 Tax=Haematobia irritans TaxID=7368 RepID=UPI003F50C00B